MSRNQLFSLRIFGKNKEKNTIALIDRYASTTRVLQGAEGGVPQIRLRQMEDEYAHNFFPDLTFILYFPDNVFEQTLNSRRQKYHLAHHQRDKTPWDNSHISIHLQRQKYYLTLPEIAKKANVLVESNSHNIGLAETFKKEIKKALELKADVIVHTDADGQYNAKYIPGLINEIEKYFISAIIVLKNDKERDSNLFEFLYFALI